MLTKKLIGVLIFVSLLMNFAPVLCVNLTSCKSDSIDWLCEKDKLCNCRITGDCSNGNLLVYEDDIYSPICSPQISDSSSSIDWSICETSEDYIKIRADCEEGQSNERMLILTGTAVTTTTVRSSVTTTTQSDVYTGTCGGDGYCELSDVECIGSYEDCSTYDNECQVSEKCCCLVSVSTPSTSPKKKSGFNYWWIIGILAIIGLAILVYFFYIKKGHREEKIKKAFRDLYQKWGT